MSSFVYVYADESCLGNQYTDRESPGGAAGLVEQWRDGLWARRDYWISERATTNNRMAIRSAIEALNALRTDCQIIFTSDSQYLVRGMRDWVPGWVRRGWKRKTGAVENEDLWRELVAAAARHAVDWRWVRGHAGHPQNEYANVLAIRAARTQNESGGLVKSGFEAWLEAEREKGRYGEFAEFAPPPTEHFNPAARVAVG
ncbi:MAG TPA: ribonuclease H [Gemmatimonadales bacterium]|nr:ribonuclease H [Gemmatimonadales bacterium]